LPSCDLPFEPCGLNFPLKKWREWLSDARDPEDAALVVSHDARFFRPLGRRWVDLSRRQKLSEFLLLLVRAHLGGSSQFVTMDDVLGSLWPSEAMVGDSGANRGHQVVLHPRKQGVGDVLVRTMQGDHFDDSVDIVWLKQFG
jgi:hypothetical protein